MNRISAVPGSSDRCPCLSGDTYGACCGRFHSGQADAPTAEALMRSRFSAFAVNNPQYLLASWHSTTRPVLLELDPATEWRRLDIVRTIRGGFLDSDGVVEFRAHFRERGTKGVLHETSRFVREDGRWVYLDAE